MRVLSEVAWRQLDDSILYLTCAGSVSELDQRLLHRIALILPPIIHAGIFEVGPGNETTIKSMIGLPVEQRWMDLWLKHFSHRLPSSYDMHREVQLISWAKEKPDEYASDFVIPQGIGSTLYLSVSTLPDNRKRVLAVNRARGCPFHAQEVQMATLLIRHLPDLYKLTERLCGTEQERFWQLTTAIKGKSLSRRETEVIFHLCRHLTVPEISRQLHLSTRTIETYVSRSYGKLGVCDRKGLYRKMLPVLDVNRSG